MKMLTIPTRAALPHVSPMFQPTKHGIPVDSHGETVQVPSRNTRSKDIEIAAQGLTQNEVLQKIR